ncbi:MAG: ABC transporter ATP-binding protein/permease [Treponema sp.]|nr:ABC transporter ATP-binding protein/permease [Treponema sp.]
MFKVLKYLRPYWKSVVVVMCLLLLQAMSELLLPTLMSDIVNEGVVKGIVSGEPQTGFILRVGALMLTIALVAGGASMCAMYLAPRASAAAARDLRRALFVKVESFSQNEFDKFSSASLITRCTNDVAQVQALMNVAARMLVYAPILGIGGIVMAMSRAISMSWIIALAVTILIGMIILITSIVAPMFKVMQKLVDKLNLVSREILHGLMVIRAFGAQKHEMSRFDAVNKDLRGVGLRAVRIMALVGPAISIVQVGAQLLVIWVGAHRIAAGTLQIGDMIAFMQYAIQVIFAFMLVSMVMMMIPRAAVSAARINEVLQTKPEIVDPEQPIQAAQGAEGAKVVFNDVRFRYPGAEADAISGVSFTALPGQTTAIIGPTGAGKSTIAQLLLRFYDVTSGSIEVGGADLRKLSQIDLRDKIGYVPQKGQLLAGTIASNIRYGKPEASDDEVLEAATVAQAMEFIEEKEGRFESEIMQGGSNVSGGQKQRLSIARALAKKADILVFDDSFSALDFKTDAQLRKALKLNSAQATVIVIAQRVGTIMGADQILVFDEGQIVGRGTHEQLLETCPAYNEIAQSQGAVGAG